MNRRQGDKFNSLIECQAHLRHNAAALATRPQILPHAAALDAALEDLVTHNIIVIRDYSGYTEDKADKRTTLTTTLLRLSRLALAYYIGTGNVEMQKIAQISAGRIAQMSADKLYVFASKLHETLLPDAPLMPATAPADIAILATHIANFFAVIHTTTTIRAARKAATAAIIATFRTAEAECRAIDIYMATLIATPQDDLYRLWRASRGIDRTGVRPKKKKTPPPPPTVTYY